MHQKTVLGLVGVIVLLAAAGVGFATVTTSTATVTTTASGGTFYLSVAAVNTSASSVQVGSCNGGGPANSPATISISAKTLLPGDKCVFNVTVQNLGSVAGSLAAPSATCTSTLPAKCTNLSLAFTNFYTYPVTIASGAKLYFLITITDNFASATISETDSWSVTAVGSV